MKRNYTRLVLMVIAAAAAYRLALLAWFGPGPDEAFYWEWTRFDRLDLGYVEHPPMIAWAIFVMRVIFGEAVLGWRLLAILLGALSSWLIFATGRALFNARVGFWAGTGHCLSPVLGLAGGSLLIPETLLMFWTSLALFITSQLVLRGNLKLFYLLGFVLGCGLLSKLPALLVPCALGLFALLSRPHRSWFRKPQPYLMVLIAGVLLSPVIYWNWQNDWIGLDFVTQRSEIKQAIGQSSLSRVLQSATSQAAYHSPVLLVGLWIAMVIGGYRGIIRKDSRYLLLFCYSAPAIAAFHVVSAFRFTLPHWPSSAYLSAYVLLPALLFAPPQPLPKWKKAFWATALSVAAAQCLLLPIVLFYPLTTLAYAKVQPILKLPPDVIEPMAHETGWSQEVRQRIAALRQEIEIRRGQPPVVLTHFHMLAGILAYGLRDICEVVCIHAQAHQYDQWYDDNDLRDKPVLFVSSSAFRTSAGRPGYPEDYYRFKSCEKLPSIEVVRHGVLINEVCLWLCEGYQGKADTPGPRI